MRKVIVNSTPLIVLSGVGRLDLLKKLYGEVIIPKAVYREVTAKKDSVCMQVIGESDWIHIEKIRDRSEKKMYKAKLHEGEVEVMILAQEKQADLVVIDDNAAKKTAKYLGLMVTGTIGVLIKAKKLGHLDAVRLVLDEIKENGFYIGTALEKMVLEQAGE